MLGDPILSFTAELGKIVFFVGLDLAILRQNSAKLSKARVVPQAPPKLDRLRCLELFLLRDSRWNWVTMAAMDSEHGIMRHPKKLQGSSGMTVLFNGHSRILNWRYQPYIRPI